jgi:hypothetical protein
MFAVGAAPESTKVTIHVDVIRIARSPPETAAGSNPTARGDKPGPSVQELFMVKSWLLACLWKKFT